MNHIAGRILFVAAMAGPIAIGQEKPPKEPAFEVASIKPSEPGSRNVQFMFAPGGRVVAKNINVRMLIQQAYGVRDFQISGGPSWIGSERYDIVAKMEEPEEGSKPAPPSPDGMKPLFRSLLADRFKLTIHRETKELPIYALVVGKNGPKLTENPAGNGPGRGPQSQMRMGRGQFSAKQGNMAALASQLSNALGRSVVDQTGLTGTYDFELTWTPDESQPQGPGGPDNPPPPSSSGPSIFTAVQEQLGLKLEAQKGPVEIIVIDHVEKATEN